jgi:predicted SprT family Zn-dependent metalloprotease
MKDLTKELYFSKNDATSIEEVKALFETLLDTDWVIDIYRNKEPQTFNLRELGWKISFSNAKGSAGYCSWKFRNVGLGIKEPYDKQVQLSKYLLEQNLGEGKGAEWEETIRHELAHAVDFELRGKSNHDNHWKAVAKAMLSTGARTFTSAQLADNKQSKYTLVCDSCGTKKKSHRKKTKLVACGKCCREHNNGRFSHDFVLRQVQNY